MSDKRLHAVGQYFDNKTFINWLKAINVIIRITIESKILSICGYKEEK